MTTRKIYVYKPMVKILVKKKKYYFLKILMVSDKLFHKAFRIHKTL